MTLSRFLKDYLYVGLGGNQKGEVRTSINLVVTMTIGGFWHGASFTFIIWGLLHGVGLAVERYLRNTVKMRLPKFLSVLITFAFVNLAWVFFRSETVSDSLNLLKELVTSSAQSSVLTNPTIYLLIAFGLFGQYLPKRITKRSNDLIGAIPVPIAAIGVGVVIATVMLLTSGNGVSPFIYFQF
jgi:D-alanyl-lipoteichoic acid acyltransferase DltB (MBOAT superfamily)